MWFFFVKEKLQKVVCLKQIHKLFKILGEHKNVEICRIRSLITLKCIRAL